MRTPSALPLVIAHRGASQDAPENTLAAFQLAWQQDADGIEGDFRLTRDGEIVCMHDESTRRTTGVDLKVAEATLVELRRLDAGSWKGPMWKDCRIPTLAEVLATLPAGKPIFIEIKCGPEILPPLQKVLDRTELQPGQVVIIAFDAEVIAAAKRQLPPWKGLLLTDFKTDRKTGRISPSADSILAQLETIGADGVDGMAHAAIDRPFMQALRAARREVHIWTVDDLPVAQKYRDLGVDSLTSNRAGWLKQQLRCPVKVSPSSS